MDSKLYMEFIVLTLEQFSDCKPLTFEVDRGDGERIKVMYQQMTDTFF